MLLVFVVIVLSSIGVEYMMIWMFFLFVWNLDVDMMVCWLVVRVVRFFLLMLILVVVGVVVGRVFFVVMVVMVMVFVVLVGVVVMELIVNDMGFSVVL